MYNREELLRTTESLFGEINSGSSSAKNVKVCFPSKPHMLVKSQWCSFGTDWQPCLTLDEQIRCNFVEICKQLAYS